MIYVLVGGWDYEGYEVLAYVESLEEAEVWVASYVKDCGYDYYDYEKAEKLI